MIAGGWPLMALCLLGSAAAISEWTRLADSSTYSRAVPTALATVMTLILMSTLVSPVAALVSCILAALGSVIAFRAIGSKRSLVAALGVAYIGCFGSALLILGAPGAPSGILVWIVLVIWASDVGGYATGRMFGGPKLAPSISPGKTWSGLAGAMALAALVGFLCRTFGADIGLPVELGSPGTAAVMGSMFGLIGQCGDLLESKLKRIAGQKDSGTLIPGHGGVLDRIDGLMSAVPVMAFLVAFFR